MVKQKLDILKPAISGTVQEWGPTIFIFSLNVGGGVQKEFHYLAVRHSMTEFFLHAADGHFKGRTCGAR